MLEASSQQKQERKPHSFHECAACEGGKVRGAVIQWNCKKKKKKALILSFPSHIQSKRNQGIFSCRIWSWGKSHVIHRYQGMYTVYCFFPDIDPFMAFLFRAAGCCSALHHPGEHDGERMNAWERNGGRKAECNPVTYSRSKGAVVCRTMGQGRTSSSSFILVLHMTTGWSWVQVIWPISFKSVTAVHLECKVECVLVCMQYEYKSELL